MAWRTMGCLPQPPRSNGLSNRPPALALGRHQGANERSGVPNEEVIRPIAARPAWLSGMKMTTTVDTQNDVAPMV